MTPSNVNIILLRSLVSVALALLLAVPATGAQKYRPFSGIGVLSIRALPPADTPAEPGIAIFAEPGVARISLQNRTLPSLDPILQTTEGESYMIVLDKRGSWLRVAYDEAGRNGWVLLERSWEYTSWEEFLKGRAMKLLPGLRKNYYDIHELPSEKSPVVSAANGKKLRIVELEEDWCMIITDTGSSGWIRWRDSDRRFTIAVEGAAPPTK